MTPRPDQNETANQTLQLRIENEFFLILLEELRRKAEIDRNRIEYLEKKAVEDKKQSRILDQRKLKS